MPRKKLVVNADNEQMTLKKEKLSVRILREIVGLGSSLVEVRQNLERLGITGDAYCDRNCPISNFIRSKFNLKKCYISVQSNEIHLYKHFGGDIIEKVVLPPIIVKFLEKFDSGKYRRLLNVGSK